MYYFKNAAVILNLFDQICDVMGYVGENKLFQSAGSEKFVKELFYNLQFALHQGVMSGEGAYIGVISYLLGRNEINGF